MHVIDGALKDYAWGRHDGLVHWTRHRTGGPQAELWFGAHPAGPSPLHLDAVTDGAGRDGAGRDGGGRDGEVGDIAGGGAAPTSGPHLAGVLDGRRFGLLVKILAAARPLSIQLHPRREVAASMWAAQSADDGAPPLLADPDEKTEMLVALDRFSVLVGLRPAEQAGPLLRAMGAPTAPAAERYEAGDRHGALAAVLGLHDDDRDDALRRLPAAVALLPPSDAAVLDLVEAAFPGDTGILVALLMNHYELAAGDAVYVPAGTLHAYAHGIGVEVMTSSDNVLRLGLTPKTVAVDAALTALDADARAAIVSGSRAADTGDYGPEDGPFRVTRLTSGAVTASATGCCRVVLAVEGTATVRCRGREVLLRPGMAVAATPDDGTLEVSADGLAFIARESPAADVGR